MKNQRIAAMVLNDIGDLLPHTCRNTMHECEEDARKYFVAWEKMKELGAKIVQVEITIAEESHL